MARSGRPGPVWLDIPLDIQGAMIEKEELAGFVPDESVGADRELQEKVRQIVAMLKASKRPIILAGNGIRSARAESRFRQCIDTLKIPVQVSWKAVDLMPDDHPLFAGRSGTMGERGANFAVQNADFLLCIGTRLDFSQTGFDRTQYARAAKKIMVDVDAAEIAKLDKMIDLPVCADAGDFLQEFLRQWQAADSNHWDAWLEQIADWRAAVSDEPGSAGQGGYSRNH